MSAVLEMPVAPARCEMTILDATGDTKVIFDPNNADEVDAARSTFNKLRGRGHVAYRVEGDGSKGTVMTEFDAAAGKIILAPALRGG